MTVLAGTIMALSVDVWTPNNRGGQRLTGTSFAAAIVSSAVMHWRDARLDASGICQRLREYARDIGGSKRATTFGRGLMQLESVLVALPKRHSTLAAGAI